jgi:hypothetical protein
MKSNIRILFAIIALILSTLACAMFPSGPGKTVQQFFNSLERGEIQEAKSYMSSSSLQSLGSDKWDSVLVQLSQQISSSGGIDKVDITEENVNGDIASVTVQITFGNGTSETSVLDLVKENNQWKLALSAGSK